MTLLTARSIALRRRTWLPGGRGVGLTLVEIMIVISIIGILAALVLPLGSTGRMSHDVLPVDAFPRAMEYRPTLGGTIEISDGGEDALADISIDNWGTISGTTGNDLVFSPRGWVTNPSSDFNADGYIDVTFVNTAILRSEGATQTWTVRVGRGGMTRVESNLSREVVDGPTGTNRAGTLSSTSGSGFNP